MMTYFFPQVAMIIKDLHTLNSILEPLLNLTAHCLPNKADFCKVIGAVDFLITLMISNCNIKGISLQSSGKSLASTNSTATTPTLLTRNQLAIVENSGGILRNISSYIVTQEDLLELLRSRQMIQFLLDQLKSSSLAIVSNACVTLSNLSVRSVQEQRKMIDLGAIQMLHKLTNSKHQTIQFGASKTLKNLLTCTKMSYYTPFNGELF